MAEFCNQCSVSLFGNPNGDFKAIGTWKGSEPLGKDEGYVVLCEGCGAILVDADGNCISPDCLEGHNRDGGSQ